MADPTLPTSPTACIAKPTLPLGGSQRQCGPSPGDLQALVSQAGTPGVLMPGDTIVCPVGVVYSPIVLPTRNDSGWIAIVTSSTSLPAEGTRVGLSDASAMFTIRTTVSNTCCVNTAIGDSQGWIFVGCQFTATVTMQAAFVTLLSGLSTTLPARFVFDRCLFNSNDRLDNRKGMELMAFDVRVTECAFLGFRDTNADSQAIFMNGGARNHIENNELQASGENMLLGDGTVGGGPPWAQAVQDVTIKRNHMFKPYTWRRLLPDGTVSPIYDGLFSSCKNLFEIKWANRVLLEGNTLEHNWPFQGDQPGQWSFIHAGNTGTSDIMIRSNKVIESTGGITLASHPEFNGVNGWVNPILSRVAILNNLFYIGGRALLTNRGGTDFWIEHNTAYPMQHNTFPLYPGIGQDEGAVVHTNLGPTAARFLMKRNLFGKLTYGIFFDGGINPDTGYSTYFTEVTLAENALYGPESLAAASGWTYYSIAGAGIDTTTGTLSSSSPLKTGGGVSTDGTDVGVNFTTLATALSGTTVVPTAGFTSQQTSGTYTVQFSDTSSGTPTSWAWTGPDGFTSVVQNPVFTFFTGGVKAISLTVTNAAGSSVSNQNVTLVSQSGSFGYVRTTGAAVATGAANTLTPSAITAGDLLIVTATTAKGPTSIDGVTDSLGNVYTACGASYDWSFSIYTLISRAFYCVATTGGTGPTITVAISGPARIGTFTLNCDEYSLTGGTTVALVSPAQATGTSSGPASSGSITIPANSMLFGWQNGTNFGSIVPSGWTDRAGNNVEIADYLNPVAGSYAFNPSWTGGSQDWVSQVIGFTVTSIGSGQVLTATTLDVSTYTAYAADLVALASQTLIALPVQYQAIGYPATFTVLGGSGGSTDVTIYPIRVFEFVPGSRASAVIRAQVPTANRSYYADTAYASIHPYTNATELAALKAGIIVEKLVAFPPKTLTTDALFEAAAAVAQTAYQAEITAVATSVFTGIRGVQSKFDGTTWV